MQAKFVGKLACRCSQQHGLARLGVGRYLGEVEEKRRSGHNGVLELNEAATGVDKVDLVLRRMHLHFADEPAELDGIGLQAFDAVLVRGHHERRLVRPSARWSHSVAGKEEPEPLDSVRHALLLREQGVLQRPRRRLLERQFRHRTVGMGREEQRQRLGTRASRARLGDPFGKGHRVAHGCAQMPVGLSVVVDADYQRTVGHDANPMPFSAKKGSSFTSQKGTALFSTPYWPL